MKGLVLEGGGAKGAFQIGAYKALQELGIKINGVAGTSIGALNGALIVQGDIDRAYELWYNISPEKIFDFDKKYFNELKNFDINKNNIKYLLDKTKQIMINRGIDIRLIRNILEENIDENKIRSSRMDFGIVTISLSDMKPMELFIEDIPREKLIEYLLASANLPAFKIEKFDGKLFLDGGFYDNLPVKLLGSKGYKDIIIIRTFGLGRTRSVDKEKYNLTYINPSEDLGKVLDFDRKKARKNLKLGYYDTMSLYKNLKGKKFYIESKKNEKFYINYLLSIKEENIKRVSTLLGIKDIPCRRALFEIIIPRLMELLNIDKNNSYEDIVIYLYEKIAGKLPIERFKVYTFQNFVTLIKKNSNKNLIINHHIPGFVKKSDLLSMTVREKLADEIIFNLFKDKISLGN